MGKSAKIQLFHKKIKMFLLRSIFQRTILVPQMSAYRGVRNSTPYREEKIVTNEDGSIIICWHPEPKFPYEFTQPVPRSIPTQQTMKVQAVADMKELYHHKDERLQRRDLMRLTWTTKHRWFGQSSPRKIANYKRQKHWAILKGPTRERPFL